MISSSGSARSAVFGNAGASAAFTLTVSREERFAGVFDFDGILGEYQEKYYARIQSIMGKCCVEAQLFHAAELL